MYPIHGTCVSFQSMSTRTWNGWIRTCIKRCGKRKFETSKGHFPVQNSISIELETLSNLTKRKVTENEAAKESESIKVPKETKIKSDTIGKRDKNQKRPLTEEAPKDWNGLWDLGLTFDHPWRDPRRLNHSHRCNWPRIHFEKRWQWPLYYLTASIFWTTFHFVNHRQRWNLLLLNSIPTKKQPTN